jgi:hypothetical protein
MAAHGTRPGGYAAGPMGDTSHGWPPGRLAGAALAATWTGVAAAAVAGAPPTGLGGAVASAAWLAPAAVSLLGVIRPPRGDIPATAHAWLGVGALVLSLPLLLAAVAALGGDEARHASPAAGTGWTALLAVSATALHAAVGLVAPRRDGPIRAGTSPGRVAIAAVTLGFVMALGLAVGLETRRAAALGPGGTAGGARPPACGTLPDLWPTATIALSARAEADGQPAGWVELTGARDGLDEHWTAAWRRGDRSGTVAWLRRGPRAWLAGSPDAHDVPDAPDWRAVEVDALGLGRDDGLTLDGAVRAALVGTTRRATDGRVGLVSEDQGVDVLAAGEARRCAALVDGPIALDAIVALRWLVDEDASAAARRLARWRGELTWWVLSDGRLGHAALRPWPGSGARGGLLATVEVAGGVPVSLPGTPPATPAPAPYSSPAR